MASVDLRNQQLCSQLPEYLTENKIVGYFQSKMCKNKGKFWYQIFECGTYFFFFALKPNLTNIQLSYSSHCTNQDQYFKFNQINFMNLSFMK